MYIYIYVYVCIYICFFVCMFVCLLACGLTYSLVRSVVSLCLLYEAINLSIPKAPPLCPLRQNISINTKTWVPEGRVAYIKTYIHICTWVCAHAYTVHSLLHIYIYAYIICVYVYISTHMHEYYIMPSDLHPWLLQIQVKVQPRTLNPKTPKNHTTWKPKPKLAKPETLTP